MRTHGSRSRRAARVAHALDPSDAELIAAAEHDPAAFRALYGLQWQCFAGDRAVTEGIVHPNLMGQVSGPAVG